MALTIVSVLDINAGSEGKKEVIVSADNSYPTGGYALTAASLGLAQINRVELSESSGYIITPTYTSLTTVNLVFKDTAGSTPAGTISSVSAGTPAGTISAPSLQTTVDEVVSVTAGTGVSAALANIPVGSIQNVYVTAGGVTGVANIIPAAATLATHQVKVNLTTGVLTFLVGDAVTSATVTYVRAAATVPTFTGSALGTHTHTFTGTAGSAGALTEIANATDLSALTSIKLTVYGF